MTKGAGVSTMQKRFYGSIAPAPDKADLQAAAIVKKVLIELSRPNGPFMARLKGEAASPSGGHLVDVVSAVRANLRAVRIDIGDVDFEE